MNALRVSTFARRATPLSSSALVHPLPLPLPVAAAPRASNKRCLSSREGGGGGGRAAKTALVLGSSGCLGSHIVRHLSRNLGHTVIGADCVDPPAEQADHDLLDAFLPLPHPTTEAGLAQTATDLVLGLREIDEMSGQAGRWHDGGTRGAGGTGGLVLDAVICASGGWEGDPPPPDADAAEFQGDEWEERLLAADAASHGDSADRMLRMNLHPVLAAGRAMDRYMGGEGLFVALGATAALAPTPSMAAYGAAKAAVHHYVQTLGASCGPKTGLGHKALRKKASTTVRQRAVYLDDLTAVAILPSMIDTPSNRRFAEEGADFSQWTRPDDIAAEIGMWMERPYARPHSGSLIKVFPNAKTGEGAVFTLAR